MPFIKVILNVFLITLLGKSRMINIHHENSLLTLNTCALLWQLVFMLHAQVAIILYDATHSYTAALRYQGFRTVLLVISEASIEL